MVDAEPTTPALRSRWRLEFARVLAPRVWMRVVRTVGGNHRRPPMSEFASFWPREAVWLTVAVYTPSILDTPLRPTGPVDREHPAGALTADWPMLDDGHV